MRRAGNGNGKYLRACWRILPRVSRSFAIPIRFLPRPIGNAVMVSYLVFRIADTIEDCCPDGGERARLFDLFLRLLRGDRSGAEELARLAPPPYDTLMTSTVAVAESYDQLPDGVRGIIFESVEEMSGGMEKWAAREVHSLSDLHNYCYYVAGIVGKLLTRLFRAYGHVNEAKYPMMERRAVDFGIALQMINVIRDVRTDHREGRHYWPTALLESSGLSRSELFDPEKREAASEVLRYLIRDALDHCDAAHEYLTLIPRHQIRVRLFCAIPLYMAVWTLRRCLRDPALFSGERPVKITRRKTRHILALSVLLSPFNRLQKSWYRRLRRLDTLAPQMS